MRRQFLREQKHEWSEYLAMIVKNYDSNKHSSIRTKPADVVSGAAIPQRRAKKRLRIVLPGSDVRVLSDSLKHGPKNIFVKKSMRVNWSAQVYKVLSVMDGRISSRVKDSRASPANGTSWSYLT